MKFKEEQCGTCLILAPQCDYCGSDSMVGRTETNDGFICADCYWEDKPEYTLALFVSGVETHYSRELAQGEVQ